MGAKQDPRLRFYVAKTHNQETVRASPTSLLRSWYRWLKLGPVLRARIEQAMPSGTEAHQPLLAGG